MVLKWAFAGVYGPNGDFDRRGLWDELAGLMSCWDLPWCIGGDFNVVRFPSERFGGRRISGAMREFSDFISEYGFMDLPLNGGLCTWSNTRSWSRIDRFLISPDWEVRFLEALQKRLLCLCLDHFPIVLACGRNKGGRKSFKYGNVYCGRCCLQGYLVIFLRAQWFCLLSMSIGFEHRLTVIFLRIIF
jgi:hypothetical protein